jgi:hypothetical protein
MHRIWNYRFTVELPNNPPAKTTCSRSVTVLLVGLIFARKLLFDITVVRPALCCVIDHICRCDYRSRSKHEPNPSRSIGFADFGYSASRLRFVFASSLDLKCLKHSSRSKRFWAFSSPTRAGLPAVCVAAEQALNIK